MSKQNYFIEGMTIAVMDMAAMLAFYSHVFQIRFQEKEMHGFKLYSGAWGGLGLLFCPAELARNTAKQNRHQFDLVVSDIQKTIETATRHGGKAMGELAKEGQVWSIGMYDPDGNSIVFKELKNR